MAGVMDRAVRKLKKAMYPTMYRLPNARSKSVRSDAIRYYHLANGQKAECMVSGLTFPVTELEAAHLYMECWPELPVRTCSRGTHLGGVEMKGGRSQSQQSMYFSKAMGGCNVASSPTGVACRRPNQCLFLQGLQSYMCMCWQCEYIANMSRNVGCLVMPFIHAQDGIDISIDGPENIIMVCKSVHKALDRCRICLIPKRLGVFQVCLDPLCFLS